MGNTFLNRMLIVILLTLINFAISQSENIPWHSPFINCDESLNDICGKILKIPQQYEMQNMIRKYQPNPHNHTKTQNLMDPSFGPHQTISYGVQICAVKQIGDQGKYNFLKIDLRGGSEMHAAIIDELEIAKPSFFNYQPHQGKTIFTMVNHFANRTRFYDIDWSAATNLDDENKMLELQSMNIEIYNEIGVQEKPLIDFKSEFMVQNVGGQHLNYSQVEDSHSNLVVFDQYKNYAPSYLKSNAEVIIIGRQSTVDNYDMGIIVNNVINKEVNNFYIVDISFGAYAIIDHTLWTYNELPQPNGKITPESTRCVASYDMNQIKLDVKPKQDCIYTLEDCLDCGYIQDITVNVDQNKIFLQFDTSIIFLTKNSKGNFEQQNHILLFKNSCSNLYYIEEVKGIFCQDKSMQEIRFFGEEFSSPRQTIPLYMLYLIIALSVAFAVAIGALLYVNTKMKKKNKEDIEKILLEHEANMMKYSYTFDSHSHKLDENKPNDICDHCGNVQNIDLNYSLAVSETGKSTSLIDTNRHTTQDQNKQRNSRSKTSRQKNACTTHDCMRQNLVNKD